MLVRQTADKPWQFPRRALLIPSLVPLAVLVVVVLVIALGGTIEAHRPGLLLGLLAVLWVPAAIVLELFLVPISIWLLIRYPVLRTRENWLALACAGVFLAVVPTTAYLYLRAVHLG